MVRLAPTDVSVLALIAHQARAASPERSKRLVARLKSAHAHEIAKAILGQRTRSTKARKTAGVIVRWASKK